MSNLAVVERPIVAPAVTSDELDLVKRTVANGASDSELKLFLFDCQRQGVHPLDRLLHFTKRGGKYTPITSIDFMRTRAADTGEYAGSDDAVFVPQANPNSKEPESASVTVWRLVQGQRCPFTATARWSEYCPASGQDHMWRKMPFTMLAKCAEGLALRKGFPRQLAGLYAAEEMDQASAPVHRAPATSYPSKPNGGDSDSRPSGAESLAGATLPADSIIDTTTGEESPLPAGYHHIAEGSYSFRNGWHEFTLLNFDAQGGGMKLSTKKQIGYQVEQAAAAGLPVKVTISPKKNGAKGEAYLESVTVWKPSPADLVDAGVRLDDELDESSIPF